MLVIKTRLAALAASFTAGLLLFSPTAGASEVPVGAEEWTLTAENFAPSEPTMQPMDASGTTWAPGGALSTNSIVVRGTGLHVTTAAVTYNTGTQFNNACVDVYEISYYENGKRKTETAGPNCAVYRTTHTFNIHRSLDADTPFCGRIRSGGIWGNYACITIKP